LRFSEGRLDVVAAVPRGSRCGIGRSGTGVPKVNGKEVPHSEDGADYPDNTAVRRNLRVGADTETPVDDQDYQVPFEFTGKLDKLTIS
jgi:hypothetical protein